MNDNPPAVTMVSIEQRGVALNTIVAAFAADPLLRWIFPQADIYLTHAAQLLSLIHISEPTRPY